MNENKLKSKILRELLIDKHESKFIKKYNYGIKEVKKDIRDIRINRIKSFFRSIYNCISNLGKYKIKIIKNEEN